MPVRIVGRRRPRFIGQGPGYGYGGGPYTDDYPRGGYSPRALQNIPVRQQALAFAEAMKEVQGQTLVRDESPAQGRDLVIGLESIAVAAGAAADATQRPQVIFRPDRIVIPAAVAVSFTVDDIKIGNKSQLVANGSIPGEAFAQTAFGVGMVMDTCDISQDLIISVTNTTAGALDFRAAVFGKAVY